GAVRHGISKASTNFEPDSRSVLKKGGFSTRDSRVVERKNAATDPTHAGASSFMRRRYTKNSNGAEVVVWGIPFDAAVSNRPGARFGPQAIRRASAIFDNDPQYP
ncbi:hypothetical protein OY671_010305, partial [Metschnikowia pulcherrima]